MSLLFNEELAQTFREEMKRQNMSQYTLATRSGVHRSAINKMLKGHRAISPNSASRIADALGMKSPIDSEETISIGDTSNKANKASIENNNIDTVTSRDSLSLLKKRPGLQSFIKSHQNDITNRERAFLEGAIFPAKAETPDTPEFWAGILRAYRSARPLKL